MRILVTILFLSSFSLASAQDKFASDQGTAHLDGYDPVAYFDAMVVKGKQEYSFDFEGRQFLFASKDNLEAFKANQERYTPAYGGWCAIAMVDNTFIIPDYTLYKIQDGNLLFFSVRAFFNGLTQWNKDSDKNKVVADKNYMVNFPE